MKYLSVCSGMEAASVAWEPLGFKAVGFSEIEPFPCAILKHRFPNTPNYGSLTEYQSWPLEQGSVDLLVGGTPCQSFSVAGLRKGLADPRGNLALTFLGLADKLRPRWIVWENVPGVLSSSGGRDFGAFLGALGQLGYGWAYRVLDAQHFGVPQRRRRVFVVATSTGDGRLAAEVLSLPEGLRGYLASRGKKGKGPAADAGAGVEADGLQRTVGTLCADSHPGAYSGQDAYTGRLIPDQKPVVIDRAAFNQGENAQYEPHIEESDVMDSLIARGPHAVDVPASKKSDEPFTYDLFQITAPINKQNRKPGDPCHTLARDNASYACVMGTPETLGATPPPLMFKVRGGVEANDGSQGGEPGKTAGKGFLGSEDKAFTLAATQDQWLAQSEVAGPLDAHYYKGPGSRQGGEREYVANQMAVRRLTPVECERLQGFPDNWSRIPWKGKPGEECPDGPRYKACGNSMAVPCMAWIGKRIALVEKRLGGQNG